VNKFGEIPCFHSNYRHVNSVEICCNQLTSVRIDFDKLQFLVDVILINIQAVALISDGPRLRSLKCAAEK
jgi:hypothetical protein